MKTITLLLIFGLAAFMSAAQEKMENDEIQTIFSNNRSNGGYGALSFGWTELEGKNTFMAGARGSWIIDHSFAIGLGGVGFINDFDHHDWMDDDWESNDFNMSLAGGYGGFYFEPIIGARNPIHLSLPILVGAGGIARVANEEYWDSHSMLNDMHDDVFFIVEPSVELEFNLARFVRMAASASYRFTTDIEMLDTDPDLLRGFSAGLIMKFGKF